MHPEFDLIHNHHERAVFAAVKSLAAARPVFADEKLLADAACVALNRLPPRYIRHDVDFVFYLCDKERAETQLAIEEAASSAIAFVESRVALNAR